MYIQTAKKIEKTEGFIERMSPYTNEISPGLGKDLANLIKRCPWEYSDKGSFVTIRYYFVKNPRYDYKVPEPVEKLLKFLSQEEEILWNEVYLAVSVGAGDN
jgi:hypothetical protein